MASTTEAGASNRLGDEVSPYLRQHAHNPVDWYPWGPEAIARARAEDKPLFVSIGYSACHWCHVMERESFDDPSIADVMNRHFVCVKVDREERPDLDQIYQLVVQLMGRNGGWPLSVFLTPELKPFFGGTYFPPEDRYGMPGFPTVLRAVAEAYEQRREQVEASAGELTEAIEKVTQTADDPVEPPPDAIERAAAKLHEQFDDVNGGFGAAPKFPNTMSLDVLLRASSKGDQRALERVEHALEAMRRGGIYDQLGGGFHRYSVDERWDVPHFEKMLYDNALLARLYADAYRATGNERYAETAREVADYLIREMQSPEGGFYSSQDADSEGVEGKFFVWTRAELDRHLEPGDAEAAALRFGVKEPGNFEGGTTVLAERRTVAELARELSESEGEVQARLHRARQILFEVREKRVRPFRDDKVIAAWNGLAIGALAETGAAVGEPAYLRAAALGLEFLERELWSDGRLLRIFKDGRAKTDAFLEDYANVAEAAFDLYEATMDARAFDFGRRVVDTAMRLFSDERTGGFFFGEADRDDVLVRAHDSFDHSVPAGASAMARALLRLEAWTQESRYGDRARALIRSLTALALEHPQGFGHLLGAVDRYLEGETAVIVVAERDQAGSASLLDVARRTYLPNRILVLVAPDASEAGLARVTAGQGQVRGRPTAYVCRSRSCGLPVTEPDALAAQLARKQVRRP